MTLNSVVGLVPIEEHVKDGRSYKQFYLSSSSSSGMESDSSSSDSDDYRTRKRGRRRKRSKHVREVEKIKKLKSSKSKTYRRKSEKDRDKSRNASKGDDHEPIHTALVRKDNSDSYSPFFFFFKVSKCFCFIQDESLKCLLCLSNECTALL